MAKTSCPVEIILEVLMDCKNTVYKENPVEKFLRIKVGIQPAFQYFSNYKFR